MEEPLAVTMLVVRALEALGVDYFIGGSMASGLYGLGRATMDADLVAPLREEHVQAFIDLLGPDFYADPDMIREAVRLHRSFNLIHLPTMFKVDVFIPGPSPFAREELRHRRRETLDPSTGAAAFFSAPEDLILAKLEWFKRNGSERQWLDVLGIIKAQGRRLDLAYLRRWADFLDLRAELERALAGGGLAEADLGDKNGQN